jgi:uncharacterized protein YhjY with autotransporter beta-barrel domain
MMSIMGRALVRMLTQKRRSISALAMLLVAVLGVSGLALPGTAAAQSIYGAQVRLDYAFPTSTQFYCTGPTVTAGVGVEFSTDCTGLVGLRVDVTPTTAVITFTAPFNFNGGVAQNGPQLTFIGASDMSGSTVAAGSAGIRGFTAASNYVQVDFGGVSRAAGDVVTINLSGTFEPPVPTVTALSPTSGSAGGGTSVTLTGTNFTGATGVSFGATAAASFTVNSATSITATAPQASSVGTVDVTVTTPSGTSDISGTGNDYSYTGVTSVSPASVPNPQVGVAYDQTLTADGCVGPCTFAVTSGALPTGVSLSSAGVLSGTPTAGGSFSFTVTATDAGAGGLTASRAYNVTVAAATIALSPATLPGGQAGVSYSQTVTATGGTGPYSYSVTSGALPAGVSLSSAGLISGTPTAAGTFNIGITARDSSTGSGPYTATAAYSLSIAAPTIVMSPATLPNATAAAAYSQTLTASGGTGPYRYAITAGALPAGLSLSSTGLLSGSPTAGGTFNFTITATDSTTGGTFSGSTAYTFVVVAPTIVLSPATLPNATVAVAGYSQAITATGGNAPYTYSVSAGSLPAGMSLSSAGVLSGTPTAGGAFTFTITARDSTTGAGPYTGSRAYTLTVNAPAIAVTPTTVPAAMRGFAYSQAFSATGGVGSYSYTVSAGAVPAGLTLSSTGVLSGTPTVIGTFSFTVRAQDQSTGSGPYAGTVNINLTVNAATLTVTPTSLPGVMAGFAYDRSFSATGGSGAYTYAVSAGVLPSGITLATTGRLSGASYAVGSYPITVRATDAFGNTGTVSVVLNILTRPDPSADPDVRGLDQAQAEATRRLTSTQIDNFNRRLEQLHLGQGDQPVTMGLSFNSGVAQLGREADMRAPMGGGRMFGQTSTIDRDRAEMNARLWPAANADGRNAPGGTSAVGLASTGGTDSEQPGMNAVPGQSGEGAPPGGLRFWTGGAITFGKRAGDVGQSKFSIRSSGISVGADLALSPTLDFGLGGGFGEESADVGVADSGVDSTSFVGVAYGSWRPQAGVYLDGVLGYGSLEFDLQRRATGDNSLVTGSRDGKVVFGSLGLGFDRQVSAGQINTYGRIEATNAELNAYTERGSPLWALSYAARDVESLQGVLGVSYSWTHQERDSAWTPSVRVEYRNEFADGGLQALQYADWQTGPVYEIQSTGWDRSELVVDFGLNTTTDSGWKTSAELGGRFSNGQTLGTVRLTLSKSF